MSVDIVQFIPRLGHASEQTDFPTIAFRTAVRDLAKERSLVEDPQKIEWIGRTDEPGQA